MFTGRRPNSDGDDGEAHTFRLIIFVAATVAGAGVIFALCLILIALGLVPQP